MRVLFLHVISCAWMSGLIWVMQVLHYPFFAKIRESEFANAHSSHTHRIIYLVGPPMFIEVITAIILIRDTDEPILFVINFIMIIFILMNTIFFSIPIHNGLRLIQDFKKIELLVLTNWPRTILWSLRLILLTIYLAKKLSPP